MCCLWEHIDRADLLDAVFCGSFALHMEESLEVSCECRGITGNVDDPRRSELEKLIEERLVAAFSRRVDNYRIRHHGTEIEVFGTTAEELGIFDKIHSGVVSGIDNSGLHRLNSVHMVARIRAEDSDASGSAVKVQEHSRKGAVIAQVFLDLVVKSYGLLGVDLEERIRRDAENAVIQELSDRGLTPDIRPCTLGVLPFRGTRTFFRPHTDQSHALAVFFQGLAAYFCKSFRIDLYGLRDYEDDHHLLGHEAGSDNDLAQCFCRVDTRELGEEDLSNISYDLRCRMCQIARLMLDDHVAGAFIKSDIHTALFTTVLDGILHLVSVVVLLFAGEDMFHAGNDLVFGEMAHSDEAVLDHALLHLELAFVGSVLDLAAAAYGDFRTHRLSAVFGRSDLAHLYAIGHVVFLIGDLDLALFAGKHILNEDFHAFFFCPSFINAHDTASLIGNAHATAG